MEMFECVMKMFMLFLVGESGLGVLVVEFFKKDDVFGFVDFSDMKW